MLRALKLLKYLGLPLCTTFVLFFYFVTYSVNQNEYSESVVMHDKPVLSLKLNLFDQLANRNEVVNDIHMLPELAILLAQWGSINAALVILSPEYLDGSPVLTNTLVFGTLQDDTADRRWFDHLRKRTTTKWNITATTHQIVARLNQHLIIINRIYHTGKYFYLPEISISGYYDIARAFIPFRTTTIRKISHLEIAVPENLTSYLWFHQYSKFIPCNHALVKSYSENQKNRLNTKNKVTSDGFVGMKTFRDIFNEQHMPVMLSSGNLLGWYRHCDTIPHGHDVDFMIPEHLYNEQIEKLLACSDNFTMKHILGDRNDSYEITVVWNDNLVIDLFLIYSQDEISWVNAIDFNRRSKLRYLYTPPITDICSGEIRRELFFIPCNAEQIIGQEFGLKWMVPLEGYDYAISPLNMLEYSIYSKDGWSKAVRYTDCASYQ